MTVDPSIRAAMRRIEGLRAQIRTRREATAAQSVSIPPTRADIARVMRAVPTTRTAKRTA